MVCFFFSLLFLHLFAPYNLNLSFCCWYQSSSYMKEVISAMWRNSVINLSDHSEDRVSVPFFL